MSSCLNGEILIEYKGQQLPFNVWHQQESHGKVIDAKEIERFLRKKREVHVPENHPWRQEEKAEAIKRAWTVR